MAIETSADVPEDLFKDVTFYICGEISDKVHINASFLWCLRHPIISIFFLVGSFSLCHL